MPILVKFSRPKLGRLPLAPTDYQERPNFILKLKPWTFVSDRTSKSTRYRIACGQTIEMAGCSLLGLVRLGTLSIHTLLKARLATRGS